MSAATSKPMPEKRLYSMEEAAHILGVTRPSVYALLNRGELKSVKLGSRRLVPVEEIDRICRGAR